MRIAYFRVSTDDQSVEAQRHALGGRFDRQYLDEGVSGGVMAADRPGFAAMLEQVRAGDTVCVTAIDRLGRDAIDVQTSVKKLVEQGVLVEIKGIGVLSGDVAKLTLAIFAQISEMERAKIKERTAAGRAAARVALAATGSVNPSSDPRRRSPPSFRSRACPSCPSRPLDDLVDVPFLVDRDPLQVLYRSPS